MTYFMGIDNGGTLSKAVVFDAEGVEIASASRRIPLVKNEGGFCERDMEALWQANCAMIREALSASGVDPKDIRGAACTGHGKGLYLWGKDGRPAYNGIVSTDARAWRIIDRWKADGTADRAFEKTQQRLLACQGPALLRWLKEEDPGLLDRVQWIFEAKDYIRFRLTGEAWAEVTDYSGSSLMNIRDKRFDRELLELYGLGEAFDKLPPLKNSTDSCGTVSAEASLATGLAQGTPLAGGMFDIDACAIAMDVLDGEKLCVIAGTWSINEYISKEPILDGSIMMNSLFCVPGWYLIEECSPTSAGNNEWFAGTFLELEKNLADERGLSVYDLENEIAGSIGPGDQDILFLPYLYGSNYDPLAKACFIGLEPSHTKSNLIRAVYEGIVFCHMVHAEKLLAHRESTEVVRLAGGAAKSKVWAQIFADIFKLPVETVDTQELGTLGCAMAAAVASGYYKDLKEAAANMVKIKGRIEPDPKTYAAYDRKYALYRKASAALEGIWREFQK